MRVLDFVTAIINLAGNSVDISVLASRSEIKEMFNL